MNNRAMCGLALVFVAMAQSAVADVVYVDSNATGGSHNGASWCSAYLSLSDGLGAATAGTTIRVANGSYAPNPAGLPDPREASFALAVGVTVEGGYAGCGAPNPDARDVTLFETILTGDLAGDDGPAFANYEENAFHVVTGQFVDETAVLDGVIIQHGHADGTAAPATCFGGPNNLMNCTTDANCAGAPCVSRDSIGAGMINLTAGPTLQACVIRDNLAAFQGAGMQNKSGNPVMTGCTFSGNRALDNGGAMYNGLSSPIVTDCQFLNNSGQNYAGAICNRDGSNGTFTNCTFTGNTAAELTTTGGGAILNASSSPTFTGCTFDANVSMQGFGGGMYNKMGFIPALGGSHPTLTNCTFSNNDALKGGGMYSKDASSPTLVGCTFEANEAFGAPDTTERRGGGMYNKDGGSPTLTDCTFTVNHAFHGSGVYNSATNMTVTNCTFYLNVGATGCDINPFNCPGGGGIYSTNGTTLTIIDTLFSWNMVNRKGGTFYLDQGSTLTMAGCAIDNSHSYYGTMYVKASTVDIRDCTFTDNGGNWAGALYMTSGSVGRIAACTFLSNQAGSGPGGALRVGPGTTMDIVNCRFLENSASFLTGGAIDAFGANLTVTNTVFNGNSANTEGGALYLISSNGHDQVTALSNCTFVNNAAPLGASIALFDPFPTNANLLTMQNGILRPISDQPIWSDGDPPVISITHSNVKGGWAGTGNIDLSPLFLDADGLDNLPGTADDNLRLSPDSPCVQAGENAALPPDTADLDGDGNTSEPVPFDLDGAARIAAMTVDMGAYEQSDCNGNGILDVQEIADGTSNDCNNNQLPDECEPDCNANGTADACELDSDGDGAIDACDGCPNDVNKTEPGACGCGVSEVDSDADSVPDCNDICAGFDDLVDVDGDGVPDGCDTCNGADDTIDCNHNAVADSCEILDGLVADTDGNGIPDVCDIAPVASGWGGRYLRATPVPAGDSVALRVSAPNDHPCLLRWVSPVGLLTDTPVFLLPEQWGTVGIHGPDITPSATYEIVADYLSGSTSTAAWATTSLWGDVNGDGVANFGDIQLQVLAFQGDFSGAELETMDLDPCVPNGVINFSDVQKGVLAFQGGSFADANCQPPCP